MKSLEKAIAEIECSVQDSRLGLGDDLFQFLSRLTPMVNVDLLIKNYEGEILLTWRADDFYGPGWHIPGGVVRFKELFENRISAVAANELGTEVVFSETPIMVQQALHADRDTRGHFISLLFECALKAPPDYRKKYVSGTPKHGEWMWHRSLPSDMIKVQRQMYGKLFEIER
jgi:colanic acid biosynthesis protein WcaH